MSAVEGFPGLIETFRADGKNPRIIVGHMGRQRDVSFRSFSFSASGRPRSRAAAIQQAWDYLNGRLVAPTPQRPYVDIERERGRQITMSLRKTGFSSAQKREIKERDGGCIGNGRYGECSGTQPLALCQTDHIDPDGLNAIENGQTLCGNCHDWKTAVENGWWTP